MGNVDPCKKSNVKIPAPFTVLVVPTWLTVNVVAPVEPVWMLAVMIIGVTAQVDVE